MDKGYQISVEEHYILLRVTPGTTVTAEFVISMLKELHAMEAYRTDKQAGLWDFRGAKADARYEDIRKIMEFSSSNYDPNWTHKYTVLVADKDLLYGLSRIYDSLTPHIPSETKIFREFDEAVKWIKEQLL